MPQQIVLLGVDYRRAPVEVREELSFSQDQTLALLPELVKLGGVQEAFLLATCNRTEFYLAYTGESPVPSVLETLRTLRSQARALHEDCLRFIELGESAVTHLFRVAAGIDSQIMGDTHIVAQIKQAHRLACQAGTLGPLLDRTLTESLRAAKRARRETGIGKGAASVGGAVLRSVRHGFADTSKVRVLVLGGGEAGRDIASHLSKARPASFTFSARNADQAASMACEFQGCVIAWDQILNHLASIDVLVTATSARLEVLNRDAVERFTACRGRQLLIVDAGIPRNADPAVAELKHVRLLNLDSLDREQEQALRSRRQEIPRVDAILDQELDRWRRWWQRRAGNTRARTENGETVHSPLGQTGLAARTSYSYVG